MWRGEFWGKLVISMCRVYNWKHDKKIKEIPFDSKNKYSVTYTDKINLIKGAPEKIIPFCTKYYDKENVKNENGIKKNILYLHIT